MEQKQFIWGTLLITLFVIAVGLYILGNPPAPAKTPTPKATPRGGAASTPVATRAPGAPILVKIEAGGLINPDCNGKAYRTQLSDYIIWGTVGELRTELDEETDKIFTYSTVSVDKSIKGQLPEGRVTVQVPGGIVGTRIETPAEVKLTRGGNVVRVYIQKIGAEYSIVCGVLGVEEVPAIELVN